MTIHFSPSTSPRHERWRNYGLSADFLGDYFANFFPGSTLGGARPSQRDTIKSAVSFIANGLLENAIKYSDRDSEEPIVLSLYLYDDRLVFLCVNYTAMPQVDRFKGFVKNLLDADDLDAVFAQQLEKTAMGTGESCMGILTMMCDYGVNLGWRFQPMVNGDAVVQVSVLAHLRLQDLSAGF